MPGNFRDFPIPAQQPSRPDKDLVGPHIRLREPLAPAAPSPVVADLPTPVVPPSSTVGNVPALVAQPDVVGGSLPAPVAQPGAGPHDLNARLDAIEARLAHVINNQQTVANATTQLVTAHLETLRGLLSYACRQLTSSEYILSDVPFGQGELVRRIGDRLLPGSRYLLPGEVAFAEICDDGSVWALTSENNVIVWERTGAGWTAVPGKLRWLTCPTPEQVWGVGLGGEVLYWRGSTWKTVEGTLATIAAASDGTVVGTAPDDTAWIREPGGDFRQLPGSFRRIAIFSRNDMVGVTPEDTLQRWDGTAWSPLDGSACDVAMGSSDRYAGITGPLVWCKNRQGETFERFDSGWFPAGDCTRVSFAGRYRLDQLDKRVRITEG